MKKNNKYLILEAFTNSEWDPIAFALLDLGAFNVEETLKQFELLNNPGGPDYIGYYGHSVIFCSDESEMPGEVGNIVEIEYFTKLSVPEQTISMEDREIRPEFITFSSYGKYTDEKYWCSISKYKLEELRNRIKS